jgi:hypothetical protein
VPSRRSKRDSGDVPALEHFGVGRFDAGAIVGMQVALPPAGGRGIRRCPAGHALEVAAGPHEALDLAVDGERVHHDGTRVHEAIERHLRPLALGDVLQGAAQAHDAALLDHGATGRAHPLLDPARAGERQFEVVRRAGGQRLMQRRLDPRPRLAVESLEARRGERRLTVEPVDSVGLFRPAPGSGDRIELPAAHARNLADLVQEQRL